MYTRPSKSFLWIVNASVNGVTSIPYSKRRTVETQGKRRRVCCGKPLSTELDQKVYEFLEEERSQGRAVSNEVLKSRALQVAGGLRIEGFKASCGWLERWKRRYNVGMRAGINNAQKLPSDYVDLLHTFRKTIIIARKTHKIELSDIVNMNQTMCRFDMPPSRTNKKGEKSIRIKTTRAEKKGFTVALAATASGTKLPAVIIFKECGGSLGVRIQRSLRIPSNMGVRATANGWMTAEEYQHWLVHVYGKECKHCLLIVDSYKPHWSETSMEVVKEHCNAECVIIPGGCTSIVQPMDHCINKPFKEHIRASWQEWMRQDKAKTKMGNLKQPTRQDAIDWVSKAWESIKLDTVIHSFLVCGISNALDDSEDDLVSNDVPSIESAEERECSDSEDAEDEEDEDVDGVDPFSEDSDCD